DVPEASGRSDPECDAAPAGWPLDQNQRRDRPAPGWPESLRAGGRKGIDRFPLRALSGALPGPAGEFLLAGGRRSLPGPAWLRAPRPPSLVGSFESVLYNQPG